MVVDDETNDGWEDSETGSTVVTSERGEVRRLSREVVEIMAAVEEKSSQRLTSLKVKEASRTTSSSTLKLCG